MLRISKSWQKVNINVENKQINNYSKHRFLMRKGKLMIAKTTINTEKLQINDYCKERFIQKKKIYAEIKQSNHC